MVRAYSARDFGRGLAPIYVQLSTIFRRFVESGEWPVGKQIPKHETLAVQFGVNPATVRKAIEGLVREKLLVTSRRKGTFVLSKPVREDWFDVPTNWKGALVGYRDLDIIWLDTWAAQAIPSHLESLGSAGIGDPGKSGYAALRRLFKRNQRPLFLETSYFNQRRYRAIGLRRLRKLSLPEALDSTFRKELAQVDQTITFGVADPDVAEHLDVSLNAPTIVMQQSAYDPSSSLIVTSIAHFRGDCARVFESIEP